MLAVTWWWWFVVSEVQPRLIVIWWVLSVYDLKSAIGDWKGVARLTAVNKTNGLTK
jgi:hypothetical protein